MPDRDYYFDADKEEKRVKYIEYISHLFFLVSKYLPSAAEGTSAHIKYDYSDLEVRGRAANMVFEFERSLAESHLTRTESRDPELTYNKMSLSALVDLCSSANTEENTPFSGIDWYQYFSRIGKSEDLLGEINISAINAIKKASELCKSVLNSNKHEHFYHYLIFHSVDSNANHLSKEFVEASFNFYEKELKGTSEQKPRWKRALESLEVYIALILLFKLPN
jgi:putative endopeptidase